ncbi:WD40 repeat domain-containing protein [Streptosporangium sp. NPDC000396]|uniref:WD40 repeat domain-containing protein n=1 Tax=Streptosporangium sp. NPDC000396 TaxID=3366185 RepID=UPI0036C3C4BC
MEEPVGTNALERLVEALASGESGLIMVAPEIDGAGGFGTTTLAAAACARPEVREQFPDGIFWVTVGSDPLDLISDHLMTMTGLDDDDVERNLWELAEQEEEQTAAGYLTAPGDCLVVLDGMPPEGAVLVFTAAMLFRASVVMTTRSAHGFVDDALPLLISVPPLTPDAAEELLSRGAYALDPEAAALGQGWPLLLTLMGSLGTAPQAPFDLADPEGRARAVHEVLERGLTRVVTPTSVDRLLELGVFAEGHTIPRGLLSGLWQETAGLSPMDTELVLAELGAIGLLSHVPDRNAVLLPDEVRAYARQALGVFGLERAHRELISSSPPDRGWSAADFCYILKHFPDHAEAAGVDLADMVCTPRWLAWKLGRYGVAEVERDLVRAATPEAEALRLAIAQNAHVFTEATPWDITHLATLAGRLHHLPQASAELREGLDSMGKPWLECLWTPPDLSHPALRRTLTGHTKRVTAVAISPDGEWLATTSWDSTVRLWNLDGTKRAVLTGHRGLISNVAIASDGTWLATGDRDDVRTWSAAGKALAVIAHRREVVSIAIAPGGDWLASLDDDGTLRAWSAEGAPLWEVKAKAKPARGAKIVMASDGSWLAYLVKHGIHVHNADGSVRSRFGAKGVRHSVLAVHPTRDLLITNNHLVPDDLQTYTPDGVLTEEFSVGDALSKPFAVAPDGTWVAGGGARADLFAARLDRTGGIYLDTHHESLTDVAISPDSAWLATTSEDGTIRIWDRGELLQPDAEPRPRKLETVVTGDNGLLITGGQEGLVFWDADGGDPRVSFEKSWFPALSASRDGGLVVTGDTKGQIVLLDAAGTVHARLGAHKGWIWGVAVSPDGRWFATSGADDWLKFWSANGDLRAKVRVRRGAEPLAITPDGSRLVADVDGVLRMWTPYGHETGPTLKTGYARGLAIAPDGSRLAMVDYDKSVQQWTLDGQRLPDFEGLEADTHSLAYSPSGTLLAATHDRTLRVWGVQEESPLAELRLANTLNACAWSADGTRLYAVGGAGLYGFALHLPG